MSNVHVVSFLFLLYALSQINSEAVASGSLYQSFCNESLKLDDEICCEFVECDIHINIAFKYIFNKEMVSNLFEASHEMCAKTREITTDVSEPRTARQVLSEHFSI